MNARQRQILAALEPATTFALSRASRERSLDSVPGLAVRPRASADTPAELMIYGAIGGGGWFNEGISAADVSAALREIGPGPVNVRINSGGGDVFDGIAMHSLLARHPGAVTTYVDGLAASAASFVMLAGSRIVSARNAYVMIHDAMTYTYGNAATHDKASELLVSVSDNIADMYAERAGEDAAFWREIMTRNGEDGTWYTGTDALTAGLVDEITSIADDGQDEESVLGARLAGWQGMLPKAVLATLKIPSDDDLIVDDVSKARVDWDSARFLDSLKGAFA